MTGNKEYEKKIITRINSLLSKHDVYLNSFYAFLGTNRTLETKYNYTRIAAMFIDFIDKPLKEIDMDDFTRYINNVYQSKSSSYAITTYAALKLFGKYLFARKILIDNPMEYIDRPRYKETIETQEKRQKGYLDKKEISKYLKTVENGVGSNRAKAHQAKYKSRDMLMCIIFLTTGIRESALMKIDITDINYQTMELKVYDKGNKLNSYILPDEVVPYLNEWIKVRNEILGNSAESALFISNQKLRMSQRSIIRVIEKYASSIDGKHITPHKLRATYGTQLYDSTKDIYYVQKCMHHNSPKTTELYIRGEVNNTKKASEIMGKLITKK